MPDPATAPPPPTPARWPLQWAINLSTLQRGGLALVIGALCGWLAPPGSQAATRLITAWDGFCVVIIVLTWLTIFQADAAHIRRVATSQDPGRTWTFVALQLPIGASLFAVALLLQGIRKVPQPAQAAQVAVAVGAVLGSWVLLHTLFTMRYAHAYYSENPATVASDKLGGLQFPGVAPTTYWDFAYYAFTIGMTFQTSDIDVTSLQMRQLTLVHSLLAFGFNTAIIALGVNIISGIL